MIPNLTCCSFTPTNRLQRKPAANCRWLRSIWLLVWKPCKLSTRKSPNEALKNTKDYFYKKWRSIEIEFFPRIYLIIKKPTKFEITILTDFNIPRNKYSRLRTDPRHEIQKIPRQTVENA